MRVDISLKNTDLIFTYLNVKFIKNTEYKWYITLENGTEMSILIVNIDNINICKYNISKYTEDLVSEIYSYLHTAELYNDLYMRKKYINIAYLILYYALPLISGDMAEYLDKKIETVERRILDERRHKEH